MWKQAPNDIITIKIRKEAVVMLKMIIRMDDDKINIEKKYRLDGI